VLLTHRYYDPQTGRFVTRDPIGQAGGINEYGYVGGDPVNSSDPSGLRPIPPAPAGVSVDENIQHIRDVEHKHGYAFTVNYLEFHLAPTGHPWDYKNVYHNSAYADFGNFNFGACNAAAGVPLQVALRGAGGANERDNPKYDPKNGHWWSHYPYGDNPDDSPMIELGYKYFEEHYGPHSKYALPYLPLMSETYDL
jgi:uncharacterized protein RhaS with RHS repeats